MVALKRLDNIELTLQTIACKVGAQESNQRPSVSFESPFVSTPLAFRNEPITPSPAASVSTSGKPGKRAFACKMPTLLTFKNPLPEQIDWSWNCTESFFEQQIETIADMKSHLSLPIPELNLAEPHLWNLHRSFADHVLKWLPLFSPETATEHVRYARSTDYQHRNSSLCVVFLMFANGAISSDTSLYSLSAHELPGYPYFAAAISILERLPISSKDLTALQCRVLVTIYLLFAFRPLEAWKNITQASQECILLLRVNINNTKDLDKEQLKEYQQAFRRIYWTCYVLETELEACLEVPTSGIRLYESQVPLPISDYEEEGMYFLLALSSLRKVMVEVLDTVGYKSADGAVTYNPSVAHELRTQIDEWCKRLPQPIRFQMDGHMLFDTRRAYLRCCYFALTAVASWPFVIPLARPAFTERQHRPSTDLGKPIRRPSLEVSNMPPPLSTGATSHAPQETLSGHHNAVTPSSTGIDTIDHTSHHDPAHRHAAETCLTACRTYLNYAEEILTSKSLVSHLVVRQYFAFTMILILNFPGVDLQDAKSLEERKLLERAIRNLQYWDVVPFMRDSLQVMFRIARDRGLGMGRGH